MTVEIQRTIYIALSDGDIHVLLPKGRSHLNVEILRLGSPDPDNNDGAVYKLAAEYMEETSFYNAY
jgi:hypothetical protein